MESLANQMATMDMDEDVRSQNLANQAMVMNPVMLDEIFQNGYDV